MGESKVNMNELIRGSLGKGVLALAGLAGLVVGGCSPTVDSVASLENETEKIYQASYGKGYIGAYNVDLRIDKKTGAKSVTLKNNASVEVDVDHPYEIRAADKDNNGHWEFFRIEIVNDGNYIELQKDGSWKAYNDFGWKTGHPIALDYASQIVNMTSDIVKKTEAKIQEKLK